MFDSAPLSTPIGSMTGGALDSFNPLAPVAPPEVVDHTESGMIKRDEPEIDPERTALLKRITSNVKAGKKKVEKVFKQMQTCSDFVSGKQWAGEDADTEKYIANITQRHLQQKVASLYAKNPKAVCKRRTTMDFAIWDESSSAITNAMGQLQQAGQMGMMPDPAAQQLLQDVMQGYKKRQMLDKQARTLELLFKHETEQQEPRFKLSMKQLVRRTCTTGVGFLKLGFQRVMEKRPEDVDKITDYTQQLALLERLIADKLDKEYTDEDAEAEQLRLTLEKLKASPDIITKEGLVFDFPPSTSIIVDPRCRNLRTFIGAQWIAQEFILSVNDVKEIYKVDVGKNFTAYKADGKSLEGRDNSSDKDADKNQESTCVVWEVYSKTDGLLYIICDGYKDFLEEPAAPPIVLERFWPFFSLLFNESENEKQIYPQSDVDLMIPMQREYNRSRQALREQRIANRPAYGIPAGILDEKDVKKLETRPNNAVLILNGLQPGQKVGDVIQPIQSIPIDGALYDTTMVFDDVLKVSGAQEANMGGLSGSTATESNIAESSRNAAIASNVDDLDDFLTEVARAAGTVLLMNVTTETVTKIVGPGAVWSELSAQDAADMLMLEIEAGSSGRPNKAAEIANFQQLAPIMMQIPGIDPTWMAKQAIRRMDDTLDMADAICAGAQSIIAMNSQKQLAVGPDATQHPGAQGQHGSAAGPAPQGPPQPMPGPPNPEMAG